MVIMVFMGLTTAAVSVWLFVPRLPYMRVVVLSALVLGAAVLWTDVDTVVARYNVDSYLNGRLETVDVSYLNTLGNGAVPALERLYLEAENRQVGELAREKLQYRAYKTRIQDYRDWNLTDALAWNILEQYSITEEK
jgi:hypothetical protein